MRTLLAAILTLAVLSRAAEAGDTVSVGTPTKNQNGEIEIPIELGVGVDLSCFSVVLQYDPSRLQVTKDGLKLAATRFPWERRSVLFSVEPKKKRLVFTVADLVGRNTMVRAGNGLALTIVGLPAGDGGALPPAPEIIKTTAFDSRGNKVALAVEATTVE